MKRLLLILFAGLSSGIFAAQPKAPPSSDGNRFLFLVDTSSGMRRLDAANRQALFDLIYFGAQQNMRTGDTFGLWTYNKKVFAGEFPMQIWNPDKDLDLASRAATFLKRKTYSGPAEFEQTWSALSSLVRAVKDVNIFILTDGRTPFHGTPYDELINKTFKERAREQHKAEKPFIVAIAVRHQAIMNASVTLPGEYISLPPPPALAKKAAPPPAPPPAPVSRRGPVIITRETIKAQKGTNTIVAASAPAATVAASAPAATQPRTAASLEAPPSAQANRSDTAASTVPPDSPPSGAGQAMSQNEINIAQPKGSTAEAIEQIQTTAPAATTPALLPEPLTVSAREKTPASKAPQATPAAAPVGGNFTPQPQMNIQMLLLAACILLAGTISLLLVFLHRVRRLPQPSLISRSMERS